MTKVLIYTRHNITNWWRYIGSQLTFADQIRILSEFQNDGDVYVLSDFYRILDTSDASGWALQELGLETCNDIILRCRLLRNLDRKLALSMIGAMWQNLEQVVARENPDLVLSLMIDYYALDILERILNKRGVHYIGIRTSILPNYVMVSTRGEFFFVREPIDTETESAINTISSPYFAPFLPEKPSYNWLHFGKQYLFYNTRSVAFKFIRWWKKEPFNFHYMATREFVTDYRFRLEDWKVIKFINTNWKMLLESTPFEQRVFVGLQHNPEASIDYAVQNVELIDYQAVLIQMAETLGKAGFRLFIKDHPNMFGLRRHELFERLSEFENVTFVPYNTPSQFLIEQCQASFTWTGTLGLQAAMAGRCAIVAKGAYYLQDQHFITIDSLADIELLPERINQFVSHPDVTSARRQLAQRVLSNFIPGQLAYQKFSEDSPESIHQLAPLISSLNLYLPQFVAKSKNEFQKDEISPDAVRATGVL